MNIDDYNELPLGDKAFWWLEDLWARRRNQDMWKNLAICPFDECNAVAERAFPTFNFIIHLNDEHGISFLEIAEIIERLDENNNVNLVIGRLDGGS